MATSNRRSNNTKRQSTSTKAKRVNKENTEEHFGRHNQGTAIILFALSVLLFCIIIIPGDSLWHEIHKVAIGLFGLLSIGFPVLLLYISVVTAIGRNKSKVSTNIWLVVSLIILICSAAYIFRTNNLPELKLYLETLKLLYIDGTNYIGGGFFSGFLGILIVWAMGTIGSRILIVLLIFVNLMFLTGTTLLGIFTAFKKPVSSYKKLRDERIQSNALEQKPVIEKKALACDDFNIDIDLGPQRPQTKKDIESSEKKEKPIKSLPVKKEQNINSEVEDAVKAFKAKANVNNGIIAPVHEEEHSQSKYKFPPLSLLDPADISEEVDITEELKVNGQMLVDTLKSFGVQTKIINISRGPSVTRYELQPGAGVKISKITNLADDIALNLAAIGVRIEAPIPGKAAVGIEVPNSKVNIVKMREMLQSPSFKSAKSKITVALGRDIAGNITLADLSKMPHLLIAGATGSGKSVCINTLIISMIYKSTPDEAKFLMIDPKVVELGHYNSLPQLLVPVVTDPRKAAGALNWAVNEMLKRYKTFAEFNVRDITSYNKMVEKNEKSKDEDLNLSKMPQIVIIIDELADLMMVAPHEVEDAICRLAQMARAAGMHLVIATQRPSVDVITGVIKANIPSRIAFAVSSAVDSRTIIDSGGAEKLLGRGDMLFSPVGASKPLRIQGCFLSDHEIEKVVDFVKQGQDSSYDEEIIDQIEQNAVVENKSDRTEDSGEDPMFNQAIECVVEAGQASTSLLQRRLRLGYARAGRLIDIMEQKGIVGPHEGSKPRKLLITKQQYLERELQLANDKE